MENLRFWAQGFLGLAAFFCVEAVLEFYYAHNFLSFPRSGCFDNAGLRFFSGFILVF